MSKGRLTLAFVFCLFCLPARANTPQSSDDLWDLNKGAVVTATSGTLDPTASLGMFGGSGYSGEPGNTIFGGASPNWVEWQTQLPVTVDHIRLFARGDNDTSFREFSQFTLKIKSSGSSSFDQTVFVWNPTVPFVQLDGTSWLVLDTNLTAFTSSSFRAEFVTVNAGPRIMELDAFGPPPSPVPAIVVDPVATTVWAGTTANFDVTATGDAPLTYLWKHEGTNVVLSSRIQSPDGNTLQINDATVDDAGEYSVVVTNNAGQVESKSALLTVNVDTNAPVITITSPGPGSATTASVTLQGAVTDDQGAASAHYELNGVAAGNLTLTDGSFSTVVTLLPGENHLKVIATDLAGNEASAEVVVSLSPTTQSNNDLWDVSQGTIVTASSPVFPEAGGPGLFGGGGFVSEAGDTIFADSQTNGFVHFVEWKTVAPVTVSTVRVYAAGDGPTYSNGREFARFTLKTKSPGSSDFDITVLTYIPSHPYTMADPATLLLLETNVPAFTAQEFRGEFEQINLRAEGYNAPRVIELDAFGPSSSGPPQIVSQPASRTGFSGASASFVVGATGSVPLSYQWRHEGTNLTESAHFTGVNSWSLTVNNLTTDDAGDYSVVVQNSLDQVTSDGARLTVEVDSTAPVVTIISPVAGTQSDSGFTLAGAVQEANVLASVQWELNSRAMGALNIANGQFSLPGLNLVPGENHIQVAATDLSGNVGTAEVFVTWTIPRALILDASPTQQEGTQIQVPVTLVSTGGVSGATFTIAFNTNYLADATFEWNDSLNLGFTAANLIQNKSFTASFGLAGQSLPAGSIQLATLSFRLRSVPFAVQTPLTLTLSDVSSETGDPITTGNFVHSTVVNITPRRIVGDNNANNRLDVGDASIILRLISRLDIPRPWDVSANDLNRSLTLDSGDVVRVLRAIVGLDPQPTAPTAQAAANSLKKSVAANLIDGPHDPIDGFNVPQLYALVADKDTAAPGDKVTIEVHLMNQIQPISGASFRLQYPVDAWRLDDATARQLGPLVPSGSASVWSLSSTADFAAQNGVIALAASSATAWPTNNGVLAKFVFTVQPGATAHYEWPVTLQNLELSRNGFTTDTLGAALWTFIGHAPTPSSFAPSISFDTNGHAQLLLHGDAGATYRIEVSSDLINWTGLGTFDSAIDGSIAVQDSAAGGMTARFYRATLLQ